MRAERIRAPEIFYENDLGKTLRELFPRTPVKIIGLTADVFCQMGTYFPKEEQQNKPFAIIGGSSAKRLISPTETPVNIPSYSHWLAQQNREILKANPQWEKALKMDNVDLDVRFLEEALSEEDLIAVFDSNFGQRIEELEEDEEDNLIIKWQLDEEIDIEAKRTIIQKPEENSGHERTVWEVKFWSQRNGYKEQVFKFDLGRVPKADEARDEHAGDCRYGIYLSAKQFVIAGNMVRSGGHVVVRIPQKIRDCFINSPDQFFWRSTGLREHSFTASLLGCQRMLAIPLVYPMNGRVLEEPISGLDYEEFKSLIEEQVVRSKGIEKNRLSEVIRGYIYLWIADPINAFLKGARLGIYEPVPFGELIKGNETQILFGLLEKIGAVELGNIDGRLKFMDGVFNTRRMPDKLWFYLQNYKDRLASNRLNPSKSGPMLLLELLKELDLVNKDAGLEAVLKLFTPEKEDKFD